MAYCRWSTGARCDLYVYDDVRGGITIHVADKYRVGRKAPIPFPRQTGDKATDEQTILDWLKQHNAQMEAEAALPLEKIGLPEDGESYMCLSPEEAVAKLKSLAEAGYVFPLGCVLAEIAEEYASPTEEKCPSSNHEQS